MNRLRRLNSRRLIISTVVLLVLSAALSIWARDIIREAIVLPLSYLIYAAGIMIDTTPQICFWLGLIVLCAYIAYRSLARKRRKATDFVAPPPMTEAALYETPRPGLQSGRMEFWAHKVALMRRGASAYYQSSFDTALGRLLLEVLAYRNKLHSAEVEPRLRSGTLSVPEDVRDFVLVHLRSGSVEQQSLLEWVKNWIVEQVLRWMEPLRRRWSAAKTVPASTPAEQRAERILAYIADELEVSNDSSQ
jgi:hypothetical protein